MRRSKERKKHVLKSRCLALTFVYVRRQTTYEHFAGETLNSLPVLVGVTVGGAQDSRDALVAVSVVEEIVINGEERRTACWGKKTKHVAVDKSRHGSYKHTRRSTNQTCSTHTEPTETLINTQTQVKTSGVMNPETKQQLDGFVWSNVAAKQHETAKLLMMFGAPTCSTLSQESQQTVQNICLVHFSAVSREALLGNNTQWLH